MPDFNVKEIENLKIKIQFMERVTILAIVLLVLGLYYDVSGTLGVLIPAIVIVQIVKSRFKKQLKQKEYLAKIVEERTIELRVQRDQVMEESEKLSSALAALAEAQDELVRNERLATVGNLTKGLLDRILNPVNYINNFAGLSVDLLKQLEKNITDPETTMSPELYEDTLEIISMISGNLAKITDHGANTVRIVKDMKELFKDKRGNMSPADVNNLCKVNLDIFGKQFAGEIDKYNIKLSFQRLTLSLMIDINVEQMSKLLIHLLKNSLYAIIRKSDKGETFDPEICIKLEKKNSEIELIVYDNGIGIEENIKDKVFEPFFTTKPTAEASGIGLYLCREIVLNHRGTILMESEKDRFTQIVMTLPIYQNPQDNGR